MKKDFSWVRRIVTHQNPDLDAFASVWFAKTRLGINRPVVFERQDFTPRKGDLVLDMCQGIKGEKSCFGELLDRYAEQQEREALQPLRQYLDLVDTGKLDSFLNSLGEAGGIIRASNLLTIVSAVKGTNKLDRETKMTVIEVILSGIRSALLSRYNAERQLSNNKVEKSECGRIAIIRNDRQLAKLFLEQKESIVIGISGRNLSVITQDDDLKAFGGAQHALFREVVGEEDWFAHPANFLFANGTDSNPAKAESGVNPEDLFQAAIQFLELYDAQK